MEHTILICDDDPDILAVLAAYLGQEGYQVLQAASGEEALQAVAAGEVHLVLLDVMMPGMDGIAAALAIRQVSNVPILFLSAKAEEVDRVLGLNVGGDDYIAKPFNPVELMARVRAALRRYARLGGIGEAKREPDGEKVYVSGDLRLDDELKQVTLDGEEVALTALEYGILRLLMQSPDRVFTSAQIYEAVWSEPALQASKTVSVHIRHIREKIEIDPKEPRYLKVVYGLGYKVVRLP